MRAGAPMSFGKSTTSTSSAALDNMCSICHEALVNPSGQAPGNDIYVLSCSHRFHKSCIRRWAEHSIQHSHGDIVRSQGDCPNCRTSFPLSDSPFVNIKPAQRTPEPEQNRWYGRVMSSQVMHRIGSARDAVRRAMEQRAQQQAFSAALSAADGTD